MKIALAGNPNSGKTTLFNLLTSSTAHVGNYPGVTVEKREGTYKSGGEKITVVDLPGIYSLSPYSPEETVSRNVLLFDAPDAIINVVDSTNLERNLYLTTQLLETETPVVVALNMTDAAEKQGLSIDIETLSRNLGVTVLPISALKKTGIKELMSAARLAAGKKRTPYSPLENSYLKDIFDAAKSEYSQTKANEICFRAVKAVEGDEEEAKQYPLVAEKIAPLKEKVTNEFDGDFVPFRDILTLCREAGNPDMVYEFASTSKVTLPGAGFSVMATSEANQAYLQKLIGIQTISYDKVNSLRHVRYLKDKAHTLELMKKHAAILNPKFQCVLRHLDTEIAPLGIASWQRPKGGYFVSVNTAPGLAKRTLALCKEAGVVMTGAGATFPYGRDPQDSNIRIAPSLPPVEELEQAMEIFCTSLRLAALEQRMQ